MLMRDGTICFVSVFAMNLAQLIVFQATEENSLTSFICTVTPILVSRFVFNIREVATSRGPEPEDPHEDSTELARPLDVEWRASTTCGSHSETDFNDRVEAPDTRHS
ncbi:hypothetical protein PsYK624_123900 [Phanerochaete sordida]|uniref:Uncharacterized protein n=1 Tax=Phanerochaete sordida TaxID=48140 RepID=A0A9P3GJA0_9APHY|nr:hypothetical protein PsYK624_123900 [Phanerochaete sordida]